MSVSAEPSRVAAWPTELRLNRPAGTLAISFDDGRRFELTAEQLRRASPSASERGHGWGARPSPRAVGEGVTMTDLRPIGRYAVRIVFSDGHDSGLYTWPLLYGLGERGSTDAGAQA